MRARNLKPGFFKNEFLAECDPLARILFEGLWCVADRTGVLEDRPKRIKAEVLPHDDCAIEELLQQLLKRGFIVRYESGGKKYIWIPTFSEHQKPHPHEKAEGHDQPGDETRSLHVITSNDLSLTCRASSLNPSSLNPSSSASLKKLAAQVFAETAYSPSSATAETVMENPILTFPTDGKEKEWHLYPALVSELGAAFPSVDVLAECRKALGWVLCSPERRKTARGMKRFLFGWMGRCQNRGPLTNGRNVAPASESVADKVDRLIRETP